MKTLLMLSVGTIVSSSVFGQVQPAPSKSDQEIVKNVQTTINGAVYNKGSKHIYFDVTNGTVTLKGNVETANEKAEIEKKVRGIPGVKNVDDQIKIGAASGYYNEEESTFTKMVERAIKGWLFGKKFENVEFEISSKRLVLKGTVENESDKEEIEHKVRQIIGNNLEIINQIKVDSTQALAYEEVQKNDQALQEPVTAEETEKLAKKVIAAIKGGVFNRGYETVFFEINNGKITLKGVVETQKDKQEIANRIKKIEGITEIDNQIEVQPQGEKKESTDSEIKKKFDEYFNSGEIKKAYENFSIEIDKGKVILKGFVKKATDKNTIESFVNKIKGVTGIDNQLEVKSDKAPLDSQASDQEIKNQAEEALKGSYFSKAYDSVTVEVSEGKITLKGIVETSGDEEEVIKRVKKIDGVKEVENKLKIEPAKPKSTDKDTELTKKIHDALKGGYFTRGYDTVSFEVDEGKVTLKGKVDKESDKEEVTKRVSKVEGVTSVDNQVKVEKK